MEKKMLFAIILLAILLVWVGVSTGKLQDSLVKPFQNGAVWETECNAWAMSSNCDINKIPFKLETAMKEEGNICEDLSCEEVNDAGCKCGTETTSKGLLGSKEKLYCCATKDGGKVYESQEVCRADCVGGATPTLNYLIKSRCCQALRVGTLKSSCGCSN